MMRYTKQSAAVIISLIICLSCLTACSSGKAPSRETPLPETTVPVSSPADATMVPASEEPTESTAPEASVPTTDPEPTPAPPKSPEYADAAILHELEFGGVYVDITIDDFNALGFAYGDSVTVSFSNGYELQDVIDAVNYARERYKDYISDPDIVYFEAGSGGGGNALAIAGKFPDFFAAVNALYCMSDYGMWYRNDSDGEFRDEMDIWVGKDPDLDPMAYAARSGLSLVRNLYSPLFIAHGELDRRVPVYHSHLYLAAAKAAGKARLIDYYEMKGVGTESHISGASPEQKEELSRRALANLTTHSAPIQLPRKGKLLAGGYLVTKYFRVDLDSLDKIAEVEYDADARTVSVHSAVPCEYTVEWF